MIIFENLKSMKKIIFTLVGLVTFFLVNAQDATTPVVKEDVLLVKETLHDFGKIPQGTPAEFYFEITNKSDKALVVENAQASCGCTTPEVPKEPIAPGATAKLKVSYNAANMGGFTKTVSIKLAGVDQPKVVTIVGEVLDKAAYDEFVKTQPKAAEPVKKDEKTKATPDKTKTKTKSGK